VDSKVNVAIASKFRFGILNSPVSDRASAIRSKAEATFRKVNHWPAFDGGQPTLARRMELILCSVAEEVSSQQGQNAQKGGVGRGKASRSGTRLL
jgi:hypothetical protein